MDKTNAAEEEQSESSSPEQETKCCEVCGDVGDESLLMKCSQCNERRKHTYCPEVLLSEVPWICEACKNSSRVLRVPPAAAMDQPRRSAGPVPPGALYLPRSGGPILHNVRNEPRRNAVPVPVLVPLPLPETESESESGSEEEEDRFSSELSYISRFVVDSSQRELVDEECRNSSRVLRVPRAAAMNQPRRSLVGPRVRNEQRRTSAVGPSVWNQPRRSARPVVPPSALFLPRSRGPIRPNVKNEPRRSVVPVPPPETATESESESGSEEEDRFSSELRYISRFVVDSSKRGLEDDAKQMKERRRKIK